MPSIGLEIPEIAFEVSENFEKCLHGTTCSRMLGVNISHISVHLPHPGAPPVTILCAN